MAGKSIIAGIDIGSNTVQLLLGRAEGGALSERENFIRTTRLGAGSAPGQLSPEAIAFTAAAVRDFWDRAERAGAKAGRVLATSAVRDAANSGELLAAIRNMAPTAPAVEILSGQDEARLSWLGARSSTSFPDSWPVADVGGSSSELIRLTPQGLFAQSANVGAVRATVQGWDRAKIKDCLLRSYGAQAAAPGLIGVGGTITTAAGLTLGLSEYQRSAIEGTALTVRQLVSLAESLAPLSPEQRCAFSPLLAQRGEIMLAGLMIWLAIMELLEVEQLIVTGGGILDGAGAELAARL